jgi:hypothetical protein
LFLRLAKKGEMSHTRLPACLITSPHAVHWPSHILRDEQTMTISLNRGGIKAMKCPQRTYQGEGG